MCSSDLFPSHDIALQQEIVAGIVYVEGGGGGQLRDAASRSNGGRLDCEVGELFRRDC